MKKFFLLIFLTFNCFLFSESPEKVFTSMIEDLDDAIVESYRYTEKQEYEDELEEVYTQMIDARNQIVMFYGLKKNYPLLTINDMKHKS